MDVAKLQAWRTAAADFHASGVEQHWAQKIGVAILDLIVTTPWYGACFASSAIYAVMLREYGLEPTLCIGQCAYKDHRGHFDHAWIELDGTVYDVAIALTLTDNAELPPIFAGKSVDTNLPPLIEHGISQKSYYELETIEIMFGDFESFMSNPNNIFDEPDGFWAVCARLLIGLEKPASIDALSAKHSNIEWTEKDGA